MSEIYISGLASGIDTDGIIEKLMLLERRPQAMLQNKSDLYAGRKAVYSTLNAKLSALQDLVQRFSSLGEPFFKQTAVTSTQESVVTADIYGSEPAAGTFHITVTALATAARRGSLEALYTGVDSQARPATATGATLTADPTQSLASQAGGLAAVPDASGTLQINGLSIDWNDGMSLSEIIGRINSASTGAAARFDAGTQTLVIESNETGAGAELVLAQSSGNFWEAAGITPGTVMGSDAVATNVTAAVGTAGAHLDRAVSSGTFTINGVTFYVDAATDSLRTVLQRINQSQAGVTAAYDEKTGNVTLNQTATGSTSALVLGAAGDTSNLLYALKLSANNPPVGGAEDQTAGTDAQISLNGGAAQAFAANTVQGLIPGVTLNLTGLGTSTVTSGADVDSMVERVKEFVDQYNAVLNYINQKTAEQRIEDATTVSEKLYGTFVSDRLFMETKSDLTQIVSSVVSGRPSTLNQLAQLGLTTTAVDFGKAATLELDEDKLRSALTTDPDGVEAIFNQASDGIMTRLASQLSTLTDTVDGNFTVEANALSKQISDFTDQIQAMEDRLEVRETSLRMQFTLMETLVSQLNAQGSQFSALMGQYTQSKAT